ncbi:MAG: hypothetical protein K0R28_1766 [Paenibacillus sp.]|jgi:hypothetical protein|nr:hypothetical protein [Paenibacillus sp.]
MGMKAEQAAGVGAVKEVRGAMTQSELDRSLVERAQ